MSMVNGSVRKDNKFSLLTKKFENYITANNFD